MQKFDMSRQANMIRKEMGEDSYSPIDVFSVAIRVPNTSTVFTDLGNHISGLFCRTGNSNIICINSSMSLGRQRFSMAHELYHLFFDTEQSTIICAKNAFTYDENERRAETFAADLLVPGDGLYYFTKELLSDHKSLGWSDIIKLEQYYQVSHKAMLYRLLEEGHIKKSEFEAFSDVVTARAEMLDYDTALYNRTNANKTSGYYLQLARQLYSEGKISLGKYKEILGDGFMEGIIDGSIQIGEEAFE